MKDLSAILQYMVDPALLMRADGYLLKKEKVGGT